MSLRIPTKHLLVLGIAASLAPLAPAPTRGDAPPSGQAILAVGVEGGRITDLGLSGDGVEVGTIGAPGELDGRWRIVFYADQRLTGTRALYTVFDTLAPQASAWTRLGEVSLVLAGEEPSTVIRSGDPDLLEQVLYQQSLESSGEQAVREHRVEFLRALAREEEVEPEELAAAALRRELALLGSRRDAIVDWVAAQGRSESPRALVLLDEALGVDSAAFYGRYLPDAAAIVRDGAAGCSLDELGEVLASYGWTLLPVVLPSAPPDEDALSLRTNQSIGFRVRLGRAKGEEENQPEPEVLDLDRGRSAAAQALARATGGRVTSSLDELARLPEDLSHRVPVEVRIAHPYGAPTPLEIEAARSGTEIRAPRWVGGQPETVAEVALRRSLAGEGDSGELPVRARILVDPDTDQETEQARTGRLELLVDFSEDDLGETPIGARLPVRVSIGIHRREAGLGISHELLDADIEASDPVWRLERRLELPPTTDAAIVAVESLSTGQRGEAFAEFVRRPAATVAEVQPIAEPTAPAPSGPAIQLLPLPRNTHTGKVKIETESRADVGEVEFLLDGERLGVRRRRPYEVKADLGKVPRQHSIIAIAYDAEGRELGRDGLVVNEAESRFWVRIVEPRPSDRVGPVDVRTSLEIPAGQRLERVDYYWNDRLVGTTTAPPYHHRVLIPIASPAGYIRVVATLDDGTTAEDVVLMNTERFESQINVELVELYVVVTDRQGQPVRGLDRDDFTIREQGEVQQIESFAVAADLPLTVGLAIDSSLSLFRKLPDVQAAATRFVDRLRHDRDRAFLVEFGSRPRLAYPVTSDLGRINEHIRSLRPAGGTAVWEGISLALEKLLETSGRRALVVFYDGDDEDESFSYKATLDLARRSRLPIYLIVMNDEAARTDGSGLAVRSRVAKLDQLARTGGGRVFYVRTDADLTAIFGEINEELRSHYLLTYYPERALENPEWRPISVEVAGSGLTARTISGYGSQ